MNTREREEIRRETGFSLGVITRWDKGEKVSYSSDINITQAATRLGLIGKRECQQGKSEVAS